MLFGDEGEPTPLDGNKHLTDEKCEHIAEDNFDLVVKLMSAAKKKFMDKDKGQEVDKAKTKDKSVKESKERKANGKDVEKKDRKEKSKNKGEDVDKASPKLKHGNEPGVSSSDIPSSVAARRTIDLIFPTDVGTKQKLKQWLSTNFDFKDHTDKERLVPWLTNYFNDEYTACKGAQATFEQKYVVVTLSDDYPMVIL